jgi:hypothetical protein
MMSEMNQEMMTEPKMLHDDATLETASGVEEGLAEGNKNEVHVTDKPVPNINTNNNKKRIAMGLAAAMLVVIAGVFGFVVRDVSSSASSSAAVPVVPPPTSTEGNVPSAPVNPSVPAAAPTTDGMTATTNMIRLGDPVQQGLLSMATEQNFFVDCGAMASVYQKGLLYNYRPLESGPAHAVVCGPGTMVNVYAKDISTTDDSSSFYCVKSEYSRGDIGNCYGTSVSWEAKVSEAYVIMVSHSLENAAGETTTDAFTIQLVNNDRCKYAAGPIRPTSVGAIRSYSTVDAQIREQEDEVAACGDASASTSAGAWYQVLGDGQTLTASTCSGEENADEASIFDTQLSVFQGDDCGSLVCVDGNNDACGSQSIVEWQSVEGEVYHVFVHGANGATGKFNLTLSTDIPAPDNDVCDMAETVVPSGNITVPISFAFSGSTPDVALPVCGNGSLAVYPTEDTSTTIGIWYKVVGTGVPVSATVSFTDTSPVTMKIFTTTTTGSSCDNGAGLVCLAANSAIELSMSMVGGGVSSSGQGTACFETKEGEEYYVLLSTYGDLEGIDEEHTLDFGVCELVSV